MTRAGLLAAAREVFCEVGYETAGIAEVVARSNASVGSLYHHFGGKADLYFALYDHFQDSAFARASTAVAAAREGGELDPVALFLAGAKAFLDSCWDDRDLTMLFYAGGGPPGFDDLQRRRTGEWVRQNTKLLRAQERRNGDALVHVLTTVAGTAGREVAKGADAAEAERLSEDFLELMERIARP